MEVPAPRRSRRRSRVPAKTAELRTLKMLGTQRQRAPERCESLDLWLPEYLAPGLNGADGLMRSHWTNQSAEKYRAARLIFDATEGRPALREPVLLRYTRAVCAARIDWDNLGASFKFIGDALVAVGLLTDDSTQQIARWETRAKHVRARNLQGTRIQLISLTDAELEDLVE